MFPKSKILPNLVTLLACIEHKIVGYPFSRFKEKEAERGRRLFCWSERRRCRRRCRRRRCCRCCCIIVKRNYTFLSK